MRTALGGNSSGEDARHGNWTVGISRLLAYNNIFSFVG